MRKLFVLSLALAVLTGCKALVPYDSKFMCEGSEDFGHCMDVQSAYSEALGSEQGTAAKDKTGKTAPKWQYQGKSSGHSGVAPSPTLQRKAPPHGTSPTGAVFLPTSTADLYRESQYRELAGLIDEPVTPIVQPPKVLRTLIVSYSAGDSLYMPRYVYFLADEAKFVLGDYLKGPGPTKAVYPNSAPIAHIQATP